MAKKANREQMILDFIKQELQQKGYPPSVREIGAAVGLKSTSTVHAYLNRMEENGLIRRDPTKPRALEIVDGTQPRSKTVPLIGKVTAGLPILAQENIEGYITLPAEMVGAGDMFSLRVEGNSMIEVGILDGDIVVLRQQNNAANGDIVVAMIGEEATLKRIFYETSRVRLQPENRFMDPIYADEVTVLGKLVALVRQF